MRGGRFEGPDVRDSRHRSTDAGLKFYDGVCMKAATQPRLAEGSGDGVELEFYKGGGNIDSQLSFLHRPSSGEQEMKLSAADKTHISDTDALIVVCRGWLPRSSRTSDGVNRN